MILTYTEKMTADEYNELRLSVDWKPLTPGQAERGLAIPPLWWLQETVKKSLVWEECCLISDIRRILAM